MGWEQRGNNQYYYKKERQGSRVKSVYVGRGEVAQMVSKLQSSSSDLERLMRAKRSIEANELERAEATLELWRDVVSAGHLAELWVIENARATAAMKECWKHRLQVMKKDLGYDEAPLLEKLLIQQAALCWLKLNLVELSYSGTMAQSITLTLGMYWEKRLSAAQRRFTRACETLARVRKLSRNTPALQFNIATSGGQQVNVAK